MNSYIVVSFVVGLKGTGVKRIDVCSITKQILVGTQKKGTCIERYEIIETKDVVLADKAKALTLFVVFGYGIGVISVI